MDKKNLKEITYSSKFVEELENKIQQLKEENTELIRNKFILENAAYHNIKIYREALRLAIANGRIIGGYDFWEKVTAAYDEHKIYDEFAKRNMADPDSGVIEYYLFLVARKQIKNEWGEENASKHL